LLGLGTLLPCATAREAPRSLASGATVEVLFTPGDAIDVRIADAIDAARTEVLVQAYGFTNARIARALTAARMRGVDVAIVADRGQTIDMPRSVVARLARDGIPVWLDARAGAAHNKVVIVDAQTTQALIVTGSFNFTTAAQNRNAENVLVIAGDPTLAAAYRANFLRLRAHARPWDGVAVPP
jgi:phosphatidylserine/phosphatidylglycerophosphate/cardiolipin synthase-like enzyme